MLNVEAARWYIMLAAQGNSEVEKCALHVEAVLVCKQQLITPRTTPPHPPEAAQRSSPAFPISSVHARAHYGVAERRRLETMFAVQGRGLLREALVVRALHDGRTPAIMNTRFAWRSRV